MGPSHPRTQSLQDGYKGTATLLAEDNHGFLQLFVSSAKSHAAKGTAWAEAMLLVGFRAKISCLERADVIKGLWVVVMATRKW